MIDKAIVRFHSLPYALEPEVNVRSRRWKQNDRLWREIGIVLRGLATYSPPTISKRTEGSKEGGYMSAERTL